MQKVCQVRIFLLIDQLIFQKVCQVERVISKDSRCEFFPAHLLRALRISDGPLRSYENRMRHSHILLVDIWRYKFRIHPSNEIEFRC
jgi:hypothetical protein